MGRTTHTIKIDHIITCINQSLTRVLSEMGVLLEMYQSAFLIVNDQCVLITE
jgi:hypothetical protein